MSRGFGEEQRCAAEGHKDRIRIKGAGGRKAVSTGRERADGWCELG